MSTETYEQRFELPLLLHSIIHVCWFERIHSIIVFLLFIGHRCSACGRLRLLLLRRRLFLDYEFLEESHRGIHQWCCTIANIRDSCSALPLQIDQFLEQVPERGGIYKKLQDSIRKAYIPGTHESAST